jgi:hypothetical protein
METLVDEIGLQEFVKEFQGKNIRQLLKNFQKDFLIMQYLQPKEDVNPQHYPFQQVTEVI